MNAATTLQDIVRAHDLRIRACLEGRHQSHFWNASCPLEGPMEQRLQQLHALGFDNYPVAQIPAIDELRTYLFFFERLLGAQVKSTDGHEGEFFHTWCHPLIGNTADVSRLAVDLETSPVWRAYETAIRNYLTETPPGRRLPVSFPGLSPLDVACNLCGAESFFLMLCDAPDAAGHLLDLIVTLLVDAYRRVCDLGARLVGPHGFPGVYCSDLQLPLLSPTHVESIMLPRYERIATGCGGLLLALLSSDIGVLQSALKIEGLIGCAFDKRLPLPDIKKHLGQKLFIISSYCYDESLDRPTLRDGIWWNPIVQSYSRELTEVYREFADGCNLLISVERPSLTEVLAVRRELESLVLVGPGLSRPVLAGMKPALPVAPSVTHFFRAQ